MYNIIDVGDDYTRICVWNAVWNERIWSSHFISQQQERPQKFRPEWGFEPWPLQSGCSTPPVELSGQLGAGPCALIISP